MSTINKQLKGSNLNNEDCLNDDNIIHPETNISQIVLDTESNTTLDDWVKGDAEGGMTEYPNMKSWLDENYPKGSYTLPEATNTTLGGVKLNPLYFEKQDELLSLTDTSQTWSLNDGYENAISIGSISGLFNNSNINVTIPKPSVTLALNTANERLSVTQHLGGISLESSNIALDDLAGALYSTTTLSNSLAQRYRLRLQNNTNILELYDTSIQDVVSYQALPITNYRAGNNISITNNTISATDTTYEPFDGDSNGLVPRPTINDNNTFLRSDGTWYNPKYSSTKLWTSNGLSDHYFRVDSSMLSGVAVTPKYVPLFKIHINNSNGYKVSQLFEITSRLDHIYYGKYLLTYYSNLSISGLLQIQLVDPIAEILDISAYFDNTNNDITVYRKYESDVTPDTFIVTILGQNNPLYIESGQSQPQNVYTYYCTNDFDNDEIIDSSDVVTTPVGSEISIIRNNS